MQNQQNILSEILKSNEKNVNDLITQEMVIFLFAFMCNEYENLDKEQNLIWHQLYLSTTKSLQNLFEYLLDNQMIDLSLEEEKTVKQEIQLFVHQLIQQKRAEVAEKISWLSRM